MTRTFSRALTAGSAVAAVAFSVGCKPASETPVPVESRDVPAVEAPAPETGKLESLGKQADAGVAAAGEVIDELGAAVEGTAAAAAAAGIKLGDEAKAVAIKAAAEVKEVSAEAAVELKVASAEAAAAVASAAEELTKQADEGLKQAGTALATAAAAAKLSGVELGDDVEAKAEALIKELKSGSAGASDALAARATELSRKLREESVKAEE